eukprot:TRINITY_DN19989_c0_g1_i1.p1 TRINITY_DN19989_c0_g1~~TRINITY_DN19989_c0_g1_i1.p1  ORF type:complete len:106 (-),score=2.67 TRINITY_DN19989_c0_g1_i1:238-555(-)
MQGKARIPGTPKLMFGDTSNSYPIGAADASGNLPPDACALENLRFAFAVRGQTRPVWSPLEVAVGDVPLSLLCGAPLPSRYRGAWHHLIFLAWHASQQQQCSRQF